jgi:hypothetical protein
VDILLENRPTLVECQEKKVRSSCTRRGDFVWLDTKATDSGDKKSAKPSDQTFQHLKFAEIPHNAARLRVVLPFLREGAEDGRRHGLQTGRKASQEGETRIVGRFFTYAAVGFQTWHDCESARRAASGDGSRANRRQPQHQDLQFAELSGLLEGHGAQPSPVQD